MVYYRRVPWSDPGARTAQPRKVSENTKVWKNLWGLARFNGVYAAPGKTIHATVVGHILSYPERSLIEINCVLVLLTRQ